MNAFRAHSPQWECMAGERESHRVKGGKPKFHHLSATGQDSAELECVLEFRSRSPCGDVQRNMRLQEGEASLDGQCLILTACRGPQSNKLDPGPERLALTAVSTSLRHHHFLASFCEGWTAGFPWRGWRPAFGVPLVLADLSPLCLHPQPFICLSFCLPVLFLFSSDSRQCKAVL